MRFVVFSMISLLAAFCHPQETSPPVIKISGDANVQKIQENVDEMPPFLSSLSGAAEKEQKPVHDRETFHDTHFSESLRSSSSPLAAPATEFTQKKQLASHTFADTETRNETNSLSLNTTKQKELKSKQISAEISAMEDSIFYSNDIFASAEGSGMATDEKRRIEAHPPAPPTSSELRLVTILPYSMEFYDRDEGSGVENREEQNGQKDYVGKTNIPLSDRYVLRPFEKVMKPFNTGTTSTTILPISQSNVLEREAETVRTEKQSSLVRDRWHPYVFDCKKEEDDRGMLCNEWASAGFCVDNRPTMFLFCRKTCLCIGPE